MNKWFDVDEKTVGIKYKLYGEYVTLLFDKEDYPLVSQYWLKIASLGYVQCRKKGEKGGWIMVHRLIMKPDKGMEVDHIDGSRSNNRKSNFRICTHKENTWNQRSKKKYKGVYKNNFCIPGRDRFIAQIRLNGKSTHIASCKTEKEAALAYNEAAKRHYGEFACLNVIE